MSTPPEPPWFPIGTERLLLRELRADDHDDMHAYASDPDTVRFMEWGPNTPEVTRERMAFVLDQQTRWPRDTVDLAVELVAARRMIGSISLRLDGRGGADFGYAYGSPWWRKGYGFEAAQALATVAFGTLGLHRLQATCDVRNAGSIAVLEKLGMRREGTLRKNQRVRDGWRDTHIYGLLGEDWRAR